MPMQERFDFDDEENTLKKTKLPIYVAFMPING